MKRPPQDTHTTTRRIPPGSQAPRPYASPVLTVCGSVARLTESGGATRNEQFGPDAHEHGVRNPRSDQAWSLALARVSAESASGDPVVAERHAALRAWHALRHGPAAEASGSSAADRRRLVAHDVLATARLQRVIDTLHGAGIAAAVLKGAALGASTPSRGCGRVTTMTCSFVGPISSGPATRSTARLRPSAAGPGPR